MTKYTVLVLLSSILASYHAVAKANPSTEPLLSIDDLLIKENRWVLQSSMGLSSDSHTYFDERGLQTASFSRVEHGVSMTYGVSSGLSIGLQWDHSAPTRSANNEGTERLAALGRCDLGRVGAWRAGLGLGVELHGRHESAFINRESGASWVSFDLVRFLDPLVLSSRVRFGHSGVWSYKGVKSREAQQRTWIIGADFAVNRKIALFANHALTLQKMRGPASSASSQYQQMLTLGGSYRISEHFSSSINFGFGLASDSPSHLSIVGRYEF